MSNLARSTHPGFMAYVRRDVSLSIRSNSGASAPLLFFCMVCTLVPLSISPNPQKLAELAPGIIWIMALLASLLSIERIKIETNQENKKINSICRFDFVDKVKSKNIDQKNQEIDLELIAIDYLKNKEDYEINLIFNGNAHIALTTETIEVRLEDQSEIKE